MNHAPDPTGLGWSTVCPGTGPRWYELTDGAGMMSGLVERRTVEWVRGKVWTIPLGWRWRNTWGGRSRWAPTLKLAKRRAEAEAYRIGAADLERDRRHYFGGPDLRNRSRILIHRSNTEED